MICHCSQCDAIEFDGPHFYVQCRECIGDGQVWAGRWDGDWYSPPEDVYETCPVCLGIGSVLSDEPEDITLQELQWLDEEMAERQTPENDDRTPGKHEGTPS